MTIRGILFDLGGTLLHYKAVGSTWEEMEKSGMRSVYYHLSQAGFQLPPEVDALDAAWQYWMGLWSRVDQREANTLYLQYQLRELLSRQWGIDSLPASLVEALA